MVAGKQRSQETLTTTQAIGAVLGACIFGLILGAILAHKIRKRRAKNDSSLQQEAPQMSWPAIQLQENSSHSPQHVPSSTCSPVSIGKRGEQNFEIVDLSLGDHCGAWGLGDERPETPLQEDRYLKYPEDHHYENLARVKSGETQIRSSARRKDDEEEKRYTQRPVRKSYVNVPSTRCTKEMWELRYPEAQDDHLYEAPM